MVAGNDILSEFVSGSKNGKSTSFLYTMRERDVSIESRGSGEINRHFASDRHWERDVTYRVHKGLPVYNQLVITLTDAQLADYRSRPFERKVACYLFRENKLPEHGQVSSKVPLLTMVSCLTEVLRGGGSYTMLRRLWGFFRASLSESDPVYHIVWSKPETLVSLPLFRIGIPFLPFLFLFRFHCFAFFVKDW